MALTRAVAGSSATISDEQVNAAVTPLVAPAVAAETSTLLDRIIVNRSASGVHVRRSDGTVQRVRDGL